ncbi:MAG: RsmD family RNA methyltransferase [Bacteroidetes bacterium]|nr:RsmD family RNA methyltransferase [Bacteroidota bacterium]
MRIITGKFRGKQIHPPANLPVRPTTDFAKESLFNVLNNLVDFEGLRVLDLFAGTGSISYEFFSREAALVTAIDRDPQCVSFINKTAGIMDAENLEAVREDVFQFLKHPFGQYDLVFADPPYDMEGIDNLPDLILGSGVLYPDGYFILEHSRDHDFSEHPGFCQHRKYGNVNFTFFQDKDQRA